MTRFEQSNEGRDSAGGRAARGILSAAGRFAADRAHIPDEDALGTASRL
jgi:hypothetical protein